MKHTFAPEKNEINGYFGFSLGVIDFLHKNGLNATILEIYVQIFH